MKRYKDIVGDGGSDVVGQVTAQQERLRDRLKSVKHIVAVMSGKGGVGKSSVTVHLAAAFSLTGKSVGIVDADINGASIAHMTGVSGQKLRRGATGVLPARGSLGIKVMSIDLFLRDAQSPVVWDAATQKDAYTWRGMVEAAAIREFIADTEWGELDYLLIDLPPGTDKLPNMVDLLPQISGTVIVTIPTAVSQFVVGKSIRMAVDLLKTPVIGLVENMAAFHCPHCGEAETLFSSGEVERLATDFQVPVLGKIPFDPRIARAADEQKLFLAAHEHLPAAGSVRQIAAHVAKFCESTQPP